MELYLAIGLGGFLVFALVVFLVLAICFRTVVATNDVHIVQSTKKSEVYGKDQPAGNTYYKWPSWVPRFGVRTIVLPVSNFPVRLDSYDAYDKGRLPFQVDVMAFFRVSEPVLAAQRISDFQQLKDQLIGILQGACRTILATSEIETILEGRGEFGERFTREVDHNLANWGVQTVKSIEFMDIRDAKDSKVIHNIMAKKKSEIEMQSRVTVANNMRVAELAEIEARQTVDVRAQEAEQLVGIRTAEKVKNVGIADEQAKQEISTQAAVTADKDMAVKKVNEVRQAEITREVQLVEADQEARAKVIEADGEKRKTITIAEGNLEQAKLNAQGIEAEGKARGIAEQAILMAPVTTQIELAREIGANPGYQRYLVEIRAVEANEQVGVAQAKALEEAQIKVIANSGDASTGVKNAMELLSSKGGTSLAGMVEAFAQSPAGEALMSKFLQPTVDVNDTVKPEVEEIVEADPDNQEEESK